MLLHVNSIISLCSGADYLFVIFFFQAEDGIRDIGVTGVQTCALPIYIKLCHVAATRARAATAAGNTVSGPDWPASAPEPFPRAMCHAAHSRRRPRRL